LIDLLLQKHGAPIEVCVDEGDIISIIFADGYEYIVKGNPRYIAGGPKIGYSGTGPDLFKAFLDKIGFNVSKDEIKKMRSPISIKRDQFGKKGLNE